MVFRGSLEGWGIFEPVQKWLGCFRLRSQYEQRCGNENMQDVAGNCQQVGLAAGCFWKWETRLGLEGGEP